MSSTWRNAPGLLAVLLLAACGGGEADGDAAADGEAAADGPATLEDVAREVAGDSGGTIAGVVNFTGTAPQDSAIDMAEEPACADAYGEEGPTTQHYIVQDGRFGNVFVHVSSGLDGDFPTPTEAAVLDQEDCRYEPHVLGLMTGQSLTIMNSDALLHNVQANPQQNRPFNISQPQEGMETTRSFPVAEVMIPVQCDVHGWMNAYIGVTEHPYFDVTGEDGSFELANLPPGEYELEAWHEMLGSQTQSVTVAAGETAEVTFEFTPDAAAAAPRLGAPLVVDWHGPDGPRTYREGEGGDR